MRRGKNGKGKGDRKGEWYRRRQEKKYNVGMLYSMLYIVPQAKMGTKGRKGSTALSGGWRGVASAFSWKGRSPLALLFFPLHLRRAGFTTVRKAEVGSCSLPGSREELCFAGSPGNL